MCVVYVVTDGEKRPSDAMVQAGWENNPSGGGVAWVDRANGTVRWNKGIDTYKKMQEYAQELPVPYVLHFRIPSMGGSGVELTHPFPLSKDVEIDMDGECANGVLFHNGTWSSWRDKVMHYLLSNGIKTPAGRWSDSRGMAFLAHHLGVDFLELIDEKIVVLLPSGDDGEPDAKFFGSGWSKEDGVFVSNTYWKRLMPGKVSSFFNSQATDRGSLRPGSYSSPYTTPPASLPGGRLTKPPNHTDACLCGKCVAFEVQQRTEELGMQGAGGSTTNPTSAPVEGAIRLMAIKAAYAALSKKQLKRLRQKSLHKPDQITDLEKRVLIWARNQDARKLEDRRKRQAEQGKHSHIH